MAGRTKKIVESTETDIEDWAVDKALEEMKNNKALEAMKNKPSAVIENNFTNIAGVGCVLYNIFFFNEIAVNMTTTFLPNVKAYIDENDMTQFSHINA